MSKPFDAITRALLENHPGDWLAMMGLGRGLSVRVVDSDLSTVTAEADKVLRVEGEAPGWSASRCIRVCPGASPPAPPL